MEPCPLLAYRVAIILAALKKSLQISLIRNSFNESNGNQVANLVIALKIKMTCKIRK